MRLDALLTGRIATLAGEAGFGWVEALGIAGGRVVLAGTRAEVEREATAIVRRYDLPPETVAMPGLTDAHIHLADHAL